MRMTYQVAKQPNAIAGLEALLVEQQERRLELRPPQRAMPDSPRVAARALHERATDVRSSIGIEAESLSPVETCTRAREELGLCVCHAAPALMVAARPLAPFAPELPYLRSTPGPLDVCVAQA